MRLVSAILLIGVVGLFLWFGGFWWLGFIIFCLVWSIFEWCRLCFGERFAVRGLSDILLSFTGILYLCLASFGFWLLRLEGLYLSLSLLLGVVIFDVMAYFGGRFIGGWKLWERVSPRKTWAGFLSGLLGSGGLLFILFGGVKGLLLGLLIGLFAQLGDLAISGLKRRAGVKDSGSLIPGHGGILDRLDSHLGIGFTLSLLEIMIFWSLL